MQAGRENTSLRVPCDASDMHLEPSCCAGVTAFFLRKMKPHAEDELICARIGHHPGDEVQT